MLVSGRVISLIVPCFLLSVHPCFLRGFVHPEQWNTKATIENTRYVCRCISVPYTYCVHIQTTHERCCVSTSNMRKYTCHNNKIISMTFDNTLYSKVPSKYQVISISISMLQQHYIQRRSNQFQALFIQRRPSSSAKRRRETSKSSNDILVGGVNKSSAQVGVKITHGLKPPRRISCIFLYVSPLYTPSFKK